MAQQNTISRPTSPQKRSFRFAFVGLAAASLLAGSLATAVTAATPQKSGEAGTIALPNGVTPAHDQVFWEDSEACASFSFEQLGGTYANASSPVMGCFEGYAAFYNKSSKYYINLPQDQIDGDYWRLTIAQWDGERWNVVPATDEFFTSYPKLAGWRYPGGPTVEESMDQQLAALSVSVSDKHKLVGPNLNTWASQERTRVWVPIADDSLGVSARVPENWSFASNKFGDTNFFVFDKYGDDNLSFYFYPNSSGYAANTASVQCADDGMTYKVEARNKTTLGAKGYRLDVALLTVKDGDRTFNRYSLIPADAPKSGKNCLVSGTYAVSDTLAVDSTLKNLGAFESSRDLRKFTHSTAWKDVVRFAQSLSFS